MRIPKNLNPNVAPQTVTVYTRHGAECPKRGGTPDQKAAAKYDKRCSCPKWIYLFHDGKDFRFSAATRSWERAEEKKQELKRQLDPAQAELARFKKEKEAKRVTIAEAVRSYLADAQARKLATQTLVKRRAILQRQLLGWTEGHNIRLLEGVTATVLTEWRATWRLAAITTRNNQELLRNFFKYCVQQDWLKDNPALKLSRVLVRQHPTDYFTRQEFDCLLRSTYLFAGCQNFRGSDWSTRLRTMLLLMRWSALRIGDAARLERSRLSGDRLLLYQAKTATPVFVPLPHEVAEALRNVPSGCAPNPRYFFWSGRGRPERVGSRWTAPFARLFEIASLRNSDGTLKRCRPHMLRDTFAVEMLLAGVPIEEVSMLLGHASVKTTEKHYAPWVLARQEKLEQSVRKAWVHHGIVPIASPNSAAQLDEVVRSLLPSPPDWVVVSEQMPLPDVATNNRSCELSVHRAPVVETAAVSEADRMQAINHTHTIPSDGTQPSSQSLGSDREKIATDLEKRTGDIQRRIRRPFPYMVVARMWNEGKTIREIGRAIDRLDEGKDPTHTMRNFLRKMHRTGYRNANGELIRLSYRPFASGGVLQTGEGSSE